jgi:hypothetical protein
MPYEEVKRAIIRGKIDTNYLKADLDNFFRSKQKGKTFLTWREALERLRLTLDILFTRITSNFHSWNERIFISKGFYLIDEF